MKYLKLISMILAACLAAVSCDEDPETPASGNVNIVLVETNLSFAATGGAKDVTFKATGAWSVVSAPDWISVDPSSGEGPMFLRRLR